MRTVQADSCLISEQIDTLLICEGGQEGGFGGGETFWAGGPKNARGCQEFILLHPPAQTHNRIYTMYMTVCMVIILLKIP
jgi:hypothetical protein